MAAALAPDDNSSDEEAGSAQDSERLAWESLASKQKAPTATVSRFAWTPNSASKDCTACKAAFTTMKRRHHCRACGALVCSTCSPARIVLSEAKPVRACSACAASIKLAAKRNSAIKVAAEDGIPYSLQLMGMPVKGSYVGNIDELGKPHGKGVFLGADGMAYKGDWVRGEFTGKGTLLATFTATGGATRVQYTGDWKNASFHGQGTLYHSDGKTVRYAGSWLNDKRHGEGTSYLKDGAEEHCTSAGRQSRWENGNFIEG